MTEINRCYHCKSIGHTDKYCPYRRPDELASSTPDTQASQADDELRDKLLGILDDYRNLEQTHRYGIIDWAEYAIMQLIQADRQSRTVAVDDEGLDKILRSFESDLFTKATLAGEKGGIAAFTTLKLNLLNREAQLKEQLLDEVAEKIIGNSPVPTDNDPREQLRAEQRTALDQLRKEVKGGE